MKDLKEVFDDKGNFNLRSFDDTQDDLGRVNCPKAGQPGHESCGLNAYGLPAFMGRNLKPEDLPINQK